MPNRIFNKVANGAIWMVLFKLVERSLGLVSTLFLVRLLSPGDFGIVAMAVSVIAMVELLTAFGFDVALIREQNATAAHYNTAWTAGVLLALCVTAAMLLGAPLVAAYYREPAVEWVIYAMALAPLLTALQNVGVVAFRKELEFRKEFTFQVSKKFVSFAVTIPLAFWLRNYWALVAGTLVALVFSLSLSYWVHPFRPRFRLTEWRSLFGFSKWLLFNNIVCFLKERSSDFVIGRVHGAAGLGLYNISYELAHMPSTELSAPINRALMPGYSKLTSDSDALHRVYQASLSVLILLAVPAAAGLCALAPLIVNVVLGPKWAPAILILQILAFNGVLYVIHSSISSILIGTGHARDVTLCNAAFVVMLLVLLVVLTPSMGLVGSAIACVASAILSTPIYLFALRSRLRLPLGGFAIALRRPVLAAGLMSAALIMFAPLDKVSASGAMGARDLVASIISGAGIYSVAMLAMWIAAGRPDGAERLIFDRVATELRTRFGRSGAAGT